MPYQMNMAREIERKFLVRNETWLAKAEAGRAIVQFYLAITAERSVRVRITDAAQARLTLKFGSDLRVRDEFEYDVPLADAHEMQAFAVGAIITKTRHHIRHEGYLYEVDVFSGSFEGLVVAELETADKVPDTALPDWLGAEITGDIRYSNASMALNGFPAGLR